MGPKAGRTLRQHAQGLGSRADGSNAYPPQTRAPDGHHRDGGWFIAQPVKAATYRELTERTGGWSGHGAGQRNIASGRGSLRAPYGVCILRDTNADNPGQHAGWKGLSRDGHDGR